MKNCHDMIICDCYSLIQWTYSGGRPPFQVCGILSLSNSLIYSVMYSLFPILPHFAKRVSRFVIWGFQLWMHVNTGRYIIWLFQLGIQQFASTTLYFPPWIFMFSWTFNIPVRNTRISIKCICPPNAVCTFATRPLMFPVLDVCSHKSIQILIIPVRNATIHNLKRGHTHDHQIFIFVLSFRYEDLKWGASTRAIRIRLAMNSYKFRILSEPRRYGVARSQVRPEASLRSWMGANLKGHRVPCVLD